jgi:hypothetical protein
MKGGKFEVLSSVKIFGKAKSIAMNIIASIRVIFDLENCNIVRV